VRERQTRRRVLHKPCRISRNTSRHRWHSCWDCCCCCSPTCSHMAPPKAQRSCSWSSSKVLPGRSCPTSLALACPSWGSSSGLWSIAFIGLSSRGSCCGPPASSWVLRYLQALSVSAHASSPCSSVGWLRRSRQSIHRAIKRDELVDDTEPRRATVLDSWRATMRDGRKRMPRAPKRSARGASCCVKARPGGARRGLNPLPPEPQSGALPNELRAPWIPHQYSVAARLVSNPLTCHMR
jgi:hypothetical protein